MKNPLVERVFLIDGGGGVRCALNLTQGRTVSKSRLLRKIETCESTLFLEIAKRYGEQFFDNKKSTLPRQNAELPTEVGN